MAADVVERWSGLLGMMCEEGTDYFAESAMLDANHAGLNNRGVF
jgi:hypothetical protein